MVTFRLSATETGLITDMIPNFAKGFTVGEEGACNYGLYANFRSRSGQNRSSNEDVARVSCDTCFVGHLDCKI